jgi:hypothetical protein
MWVIVWLPIEIEGTKIGNEGSISNGRLAGASTRQAIGKIGNEGSISNGKSPHFVVC